MTEAFWQKLAEQGWLGILYPEEAGGSGLGLVDMTVLMEEMGRAVMPGPFLATVLLGGAMILEAGSPAQRQEWLPRIAAGSAKVSLAWTEPDARWDAAGIVATGRETAGGFVLSGAKLFVPDAHVSDALVVAVRTRDGSTMEDGVSLFLVPGASPGLAVTPLPTIDETASCARSGSTMSPCLPKPCSARSTAAGRRCRACANGRPWHCAPRCAAAPNGCST